MASKRIFITGGASGLGQALALRCARAGWRVCIGDVHGERGRQTEAALQAFSAESCFISCDVRQEADLQRVCQDLEQRWAGLDVLVNNAGIAHTGHFEEISMSDWSTVLDINLLGVVRGCKVFVPLFQRQGNGHIVNMASVAGLFQPPWLSAYNVSKAGIVKLSETLEIELHGQVQVSVVCPFFVRTNLHESVTNSEPRLVRMMEKVFSLGYLSAEDVAERVFACLENPRFYVLPHTRVKLFWWLKSWLPHRLYVQLFRRIVRLVE